MMSLLMDGRARTATEMSHAAGVTAQTASAHLARLVDGGLLTVARQGRHRYFRLAGAEVADLMERLMTLAVGRPQARPIRFPRGEAMRNARTCYDHLAGRLGVALADSMVEAGRLVPAGEDFELTPAGTAFLAGLGVDLEAARAKRRAFARQCVDWSERRPHLAGALGAALLDRLEDLGWVERTADRTVRITRRGAADMPAQLGFAWPPAG